MENGNLDSRSRLLQVMKMSGLNGKEFAAKVNVSPSTISQITSSSEKARKTDLTESVVNKILMAFPQFSLSYEWLLNGIGPMRVQAQQPSLFDSPAQQDGLNPSNVSASTRVKLTGAPGSAAYDADDATDTSSVNEAAEDSHDAPTADVIPSVNDAPAQNTASNQSAAATPHHTTSTAANDIDHDNVPGSPDQPNDAPAFPRGNAPSIERIVIFYSDGTFADYSPRGKRQA